MPMLNDALHPSFREPFQIVLQRNPGEKEFQQAVFEVMQSLEPIAGRRPEYSQWSIVKRMIEPERQNHLPRAMGR